MCVGDDNQVKVAEHCIRNSKHAVLQDFNPRQIRERVGWLKGHSAASLCTTSINSEPVISVAAIAVFDQPQSLSDMPISLELVTSWLR